MAISVEPLRFHAIVPLVMHVSHLLCFAICFVVKLAPLSWSDTGNSSPNAFRVTCCCCFLDAHPMLHVA